MFEPTRATTLTIESSSALFFGARTSAETSGGPLRKFGCGYPYLENHPTYATASSFWPAIRPTKPDNPSLASVCPVPVAHDPHNQLGRAGLTASSYRTPPKPLAARPQLRPCDLRKPRSIRRKQMTPNPLPKNRFGSGVTPRPVVHEPHIQLAGANLHCGHRRDETQTSSAADLYPGYTAIEFQNPRAGGVSCAHRRRDTQGPPGTRVFPANRLPTPKAFAPENSWLTHRSGAIHANTGLAITFAQPIDEALNRR